MKKRYFFIIISAIMFSNVAFAGIGKKIKDIGNWHIYRNVSSMSDAVTCTGILGNNFAVQLNNNALSFVVNGGPEGYRFRVDDKKASGMIVNSGLASNLGFVIITSENFQKILNGTRLRVLVVTYQGNVNIDINISHIRSAEKFISQSSKCH